MVEMHCPECRTLRVVEQPPCVDGHVDCPEWVCLGCGTAIVVGWLAGDATTAAPAADAAA